MGDIRDLFPGGFGTGPQPQIEDFIPMPNISDDLGVPFFEIRNRPPGPLPEADGYPHTIIERLGPDGQYTTHNKDGTWKQYRGAGKAHGNIPRPNVKETSINRSPDGTEFISKPRVRPARPEEIPGGNSQ
ncbi:MAG: hypothetical protein F6K00_02445 [Leptolyngbya sp. SIOISBB]|nr:hypothetical protein [Leptolyngbya sp. SIOISBB]